jgi:MSHA biogenesis protein MshN
VVPIPAKVQPKAAAAAKTTAAPAAPRSLNLDVPPARILPAPVPTSVQPQGPTKLEKRDRIRAPDERAEAEFRRGVGLLNQGRTSEAEEVFAGALAASPGHEAARQALVAMQLEQRRIDEARRLLQEGVALHPGNARFASVLARVYLERKDYAGALGAVSGLKGPAQGDPEIQAISGTALQRLGRHAEAVEAFRGSLRREPQNGAVWMGLGISLEVLGKKSDAAEAFQRAAASGSLSTDARGYAEQRARQLQ